MPFSNLHIKFLTTCILTTALLSTATPSISAATKPIEVVTATGVVATDVPPYMLKGTVMVSLQTIQKIQPSDIRLTWDQAKQTATLDYTDNAQSALQFQVGSTYVNVDGKHVTLAQPVLIHNKRVMVPLRAISQLMGLSVQWDHKQNRIVIGNTDHLSSSVTSTDSLAQQLAVARRHTLNLKQVIVPPELPSMGLMTVTSYFPIGVSNQYFQDNGGRIIYYEVRNNQAQQLWAATYDNKPAINKGLLFLPYQITKEVGTRPVVSTPLAYYKINASVDNLFYGLVDINGNQQEIGRVDASSTKQALPVIEQESTDLK
ncbi:copper amine oxidase N-terminal domain-containing protein [Paenibacillus sp. PsM32]|uniref:copper amine oxidase N-terminal domain-containing protein n=1 Tax=Paenibacillus sp. PsM32 TaxID=3030536 RepID=UPI00263BC86C|nr:copper amine oxidase N-terminal domain-containing protein [Paenibacillus sp. PsM32]MDN4616709.1 copper amine oxidase N-terminal domain-containing protein [Paenibacillus sp. PsM32]